jgi:hypothetical protein
MVAEHRGWETAGAAAKLVTPCIRAITLSRMDGESSDRNQANTLPNRISNDQFNHRV